jgi:hypothetical protein
MSSALLARHSRCTWPRITGCPTAQLLQARHGFTTAETPAQRDATTAALTNAGEELRQAAEEIDGFFTLPETIWAAGRRGRDDLN